MLKGISWKNDKDMLCNDDRIYCISPSGKKSNNFCWALNELISAKLAKILELPIPNYTLLQYEEKLYFGSEKLINVERLDSYLQGGKTLENLSNKDTIPFLLLFDVWISNSDRRMWNVLIKNDKLYIIDHDKALIGNGNSDLHRLSPPLETKNIKDFLACKELNSTIKNWTRVSKCLGSINSISKETINKIVIDTPREWWPSQGNIQEEVAKFLVEWREKIPILLNKLNNK